MNDQETITTGSATMPDVTNLKEWMLALIDISDEQGCEIVTTDVARMLQLLDVDDFTGIEEQVFVVVLHAMAACCGFYGETWRKNVTLQRDITLDRSRVTPPKNTVLPLSGILYLGGASDFQCNVTIVMVGKNLHVVNVFNSRLCYSHPFIPNSCIRLEHGQLKIKVQPMLRLIKEMLFLPMRNSISNQIVHGSLFGLPETVWWKLSDYLEKDDLKQLRVTCRTLADSELLRIIIKHK